MRVRALGVVRSVVPYDAFAWPLTDPETSVGTDPLADVPSLSELPTLIRLKYQAPHRWTSLNGVQTLAGAGPSPWRELLAGHGIRDVASLAFTDRFGCWAFLDLWREREFSAEEVALLAAVRPALTRALRDCMAHGLRVAPAPWAEAGPAVLLLSPALDVREQTEQGELLLRQLLPTEADRAPVPAGAYNVAAQLEAVETGVDSHPAVARSLLPDGRLARFRAARLGGPEGDIAVTIEPAPPADRLALFGVAHGLTPRERQVLACLADGDDTRGVAARLSMSEHTVGGHLKAITAKTGLRSRRTLLARATA
ncbi:LuxR family transcriptional regulator [Nocardioides gansuensis]|uniref:LuxR family transcriptional regulator n=1 Tax=Nocardioides gansuensis TaxID=2138300 RepID=A0A2T8F8Y5_9ACTN|nr:LuxR family transcriptional regulator [Nocardioides gansuensis]